MEAAGVKAEGDGGSRRISSSVLLKKAQPLMPRFSQLQLVGMPVSTAASSSLPFSSLLFPPLAPSLQHANVNLNHPPPDWLRATSPAILFSHAHLTTPPVSDSKPSR